MVFMTTFFIGMISFTGVIPVIGEDRGAYYRERASQTYNALWYFVAGTIAEIPYVFGSTFLFTIVLFPMVGFERVPDFFFYWLNLALFVLMMTYAGMFLAYALPTIEVGMIIDVLLGAIFAMYVGFNPPASTTYKWLYQTTPHRYTLETLATIVFGNSDDSRPSRVACKGLKNTPPTVPEGVRVTDFIDTVFNMSYDHVWRDAFVILGCDVVFCAFELVSLRCINHQKR